MFFHHHAALVIGATAVIAVTAFAVHAAASAPLPGPSITWGPTTGGAAASAQPSAVSGVQAIPTATPSPSAAAGPLSGLQVPLSAMFRQLNSETRATAVGQYSILQSIQNAIRRQVENFLHWVTGGK